MEVRNMKKNRIKASDVLRLLCLLFVLAFGFATIVATGGGGGGGGSTSSSTGPGSVAVLVADGPADDFVGITICVSEVSLIPPEGSGRSPVSIFETDPPDCHQIELLEYRDRDFLLTLKRRVPPGTYAKVRMKVEWIQSNGGPIPCDKWEIKLPSGRIDLNPRQPFTVKSGEILSVRLDIDANKSINLHPAGKSEKCIFRPVVFVDIEPMKIRQRCPLVVKGTIIEVIDRNNDGIVEGFKLNLGGRRGDLDVRLARDTAVFDDEGFPLPSFATTDDLARGDYVWARGDLDEEGDLNASQVVVGDVLLVKGTAQNSLNPLGVFPLFLDPNQALTGGSVDVRVFRESSLFFGCDTEAGFDDIQRGVGARVVGKYSVEDAQLRAAVLFLNPEEISGEIISVADQDEGKDITIIQAGGNSVTVFVPMYALMKLRGDGEVPMSLLCEGRRVTVAVDPEKILTAQKVVVEEDIREGAVDAIDESAGILTIDGQTVFVQQFATIQDQRGTEDVLVELDEIRIGDTVKYFGLTACQGESGFHAFVILIVER
jgi:hypothetical protein